MDALLQDRLGRLQEDRSHVMSLTFKQCLTLEAKYRGNIGMMEMVRFYRIATDEEKAHLKRLIAAGRQEEAWKLLQKVTGMELEDA